MNHYKLVNDDKTHYEIHDERDGSRFKVSKKDLKGIARSKISKIPKFNEGASPEQIEEAPIVNAEAAMLGWPGFSISGQPQAATPAPALTEAPVVAPVQQEQAPVAVAPESASQAGSLDNQIIGSMERQAGLLSQKADEEAAALNEQDLVAIKARQEFQQRMDGLQTRADILADEIAGAKIDPNQYWNSLGTGGKIGTALSIMFGGLGAGLSKTTQNMAWDAVQKNIERDIDSQKADLGKKQTMLSDNLRMQGNLMAAEQATRIQTNAILQGYMAKIAAKTSSQMVHEQVRQKILELKKDSQMRLGSMDPTTGMNPVQLQQMAITDGIPASAIPRLDKDQRKQLIKLPNGKFADAGNPEAAKLYTGRVAAASVISTNLIKLEQLVRKYGTEEMTDSIEKDMTGLIRSIATESAKLKDPTTGVKQEEQRGYEEQLFKPGSIGNYLTSRKTVERTLRNYRGMIQDELKVHMRESGIPALSNPTNMPSLGAQTEMTPEQKAKRREELLKKQATPKAGK